LKTSFRHDFAAAGVDKASGVIRGVSVITEGAAKGHDLMVDAKTLKQVYETAKAFPDGVKVKVNHGSGFEEIVGALRNFRIDGNQVRADLHLIKSHPRFAAIVEVAQMMPAAVGLSIAFSGAHEVQGGTRYARCAELYSVDLVDTPAANPNGLFSAPKSVTRAEFNTFTPAQAMAFCRRGGKITD
jgi:hypothetical protein